MTERGDPAVTAETMATGRTTDFARNEALEDLLAELADLLAPAEAAATARFERPRHPVVLVVGGPRSGSTLTMQTLAATGAYTYPTNLLSRFASAPAIGATIQALLTDPRYDFKGELADVGGPITFRSALGKSSGALQPNEFWYLWRRFFPISEPRRLSVDELDRVDGRGFLAALAGMEAPWDRPLALKGMLLQQNLGYLADLLDRVVFVDVRRHPLFQCQSILNARESFFGTRDRWYSIKPPEYDELARLDPIRQVAGQVFHTRRRLDADLARQGDERVVVMDYADFCDRPAALHERIAVRVAALGGPEPAPYVGPDRFDHMDRIRLDPADWDALCDAWIDVGGAEADLVRPEAVH